MNIVLALVNKYLYLYYYIKNSVFFFFLGGRLGTGSYLDGVLNLILLNFSGALIQRGGFFFF